jgi:hypothetical protein
LNADFKSKFDQANFDDDFGDFSQAPSSSADMDAAEEDYDFSAHSIEISESAVAPPVPLPTTDLQASALATSAEEPLGPGVAEDAKLESDGKVSRVVDGQEVFAPADEIVLAAEAVGSASSDSSARSPT